MDEDQRQFCKLLGKLNMSSKSIETAIHHLSIHKQSLAQMLPCILEVLEREKLNVRINICYFLKDLCNAIPAKAPFLEWLNSNLVSIVDRAVPLDQLGSIALANIRPVRRAIDQLETSLHPTVYAAACSHLDKKASEQPQGEAQPLSREDIIKRMEEDRERTKRIKEAKWQIVDGDSEFERMWSSLGGLSELDKTRMRYQNELAAMSRS